MALEFELGGGLAAALLGYFVFALIRPELF
jgi:K+-transporting ATPase KdpF subunit